MRSKRELADVLAQVGLFAKCTKSELRTVARHAESVRLGAGEVLTRQGDPGDAFYVLLDGEATVEADGRVTGTLGPGDYLGELALLDGGARSATVTTTTDAEVAVLGVRMFRTLLREFPDLTTQLLAGLAASLREARAG